MFNYIISFFILLFFIGCGSEPSGATPFKLPDETKIFSTSNIQNVSYSFVKYIKKKNEKKDVIMKINNKSKYNIYGITGTYECLDIKNNVVYESGWSTFHKKPFVKTGGSTDFSLLNYVPNSVIKVKFSPKEYYVTE